MRRLPPRSIRPDTLFPDTTLVRSIAATVAILDAGDRTALGDDGDRPVSFELPNGMIFDMSAFDYVRDWAAPQFAFHHVAAYAVLRHMGVPLGKADYVGYRSEEHTSELQSLMRTPYADFCLKKKK